MNDPTKIIDAHYDTYTDKIENIGQQFFINELRPFLVRHNLIFVSGMGSYSLGTLKSNRSIYLNEIPKFKYMDDILGTQVPGTNNCFAEFMPSYTERLKSERQKHL